MSLGIGSVRNLSSSYTRNQQPQGELLTDVTWLPIATVHIAAESGQLGVDPTHLKSAGDQCRVSGKTLEARAPGHRAVLCSLPRAV
jgi:hypothetical protein